MTKTLRQTLFPDDKVLELVKLLEELPGRILDAGNIIITKNFELMEPRGIYESARAEMKAYAEIVLDDITKEVDDKGKKIYANKENREARQTEYLKTDKTYLALLSDVGKAELAYKQAQQKVDFAKGREYFAKKEFEATLRILATIAGISREKQTIETKFLQDKITQGDN